MLSEIKLAFRRLLKAPAFSAIAIAILALGIGANTAVFSVVEAVLIKPLPYQQPDELKLLRSAIPGQFGFFTLTEFCDYQAENRTFSGMAAIGTFNSSMVEKGQGILVQGLRTSANLFTLLGVKPAAGRLFVPSDDKLEAEHVAVISHSLWQSHFGGKPDVVGRSVLLSGKPYTIVGVLPGDFVIPVNGFNNDVCIPLQPDADPARHQASALHNFRVVVRIPPGMSTTQALADSDTILSDLRQHYPTAFQENGFHYTIIPLNEEIVGKTRPVLITMLCVVAALLALACANLAGLLLVRTMGRERELAIRSALGGSRFQIARLLVIECLVLALLGGLLGVLFGRWGLDAMLSVLPADIPRSHELRFDGIVYAVAALVTLIAGIIPGLAPIWFVLRTDLRQSIASSGRTATNGSGQIRLRQILASVQIALALSLLICTGLFLRSFRAAAAQPLGFDPNPVLSARLTLPEVGYPDKASLLRYYRTVNERVASIQGVESVGYTGLLPLGPGLSTTEYSVIGRPPVAGGVAPSANYRVVDPTYFSTMQIRLLQGRAFVDQDDDGHPLVAVVSRTLASSAFAGASPLGQRISLDDTPTGTRTFEIVGVVDDVKQTRVEDDPTPDVYIPMRQMDGAAVPWLRFRTFMVVRTSVDPASIESALRHEIASVDATVPVSYVRTMKEVAAYSIAIRRFTLLIVGFLALTALIITCAGVYAVISYGVEQRRREVGIRMALGASGEQILWLILSEGLRVVLLGAVLGSAAALMLSQLMAAQLYGVSSRDPEAMVLAVLVLFAIAFVACWFPANRAARIQALVALQAD